VFGKKPGNFFIRVQGRLFGGGGGGGIEREREGGREGDKLRNTEKLNKEESIHETA
jgi:hypothetical protein